MTQRPGDPQAPSPTPRSFPDADRSQPYEGFLESDEILRAIRAGEVDAFVVHSGDQEQVFTLDRAQKSYLALLEQVQEGSLTLTGDGIVSHAGSRIATMLRTEPGVLQGQSFFDYVAPHDHSRFRSFLAGALDEQAREEMELLTRGRERSLPVILRGHRFEFDSETRGVGVIVQALSEERILEKLSESEARYRYAAQAANDVIWDWDLAEGKIQFNTSLGKSFGWDVLSTTIDWWEERVHADDRQRIFGGLRGAIADGAERWEGAFHFQRADMTYAYVFNRAFIVRDERGGSTRVIGALLDLSERYKYEQALKNAEERLRSAVEAGEIGTWKMDLRRRLTTRDAKLNALLGLPEQETTSPHEDFLAMVDPQDRAGMEQQFGASLEKGGPYELVYRIVRPDGAVRWMRERGRIFRATDGPVYATGATVDITEQKQASAALQELNQKLEQRVEEKTRTIRTRSIRLRHLANEQTKIIYRERKKIADLMHNDIQQILVSVLMCMKVVDRHVSDPQALRTIETSRDLLKEAIDKTRLMTIELHPPIFQHGSLLEALNWIVSEKKKKYNLIVHLELEAGLERPGDEIVYTIFDCIREILFNVVKHSGKTEATLALRRDGDRLVVCVSDQGKGCESLDIDARGIETHGGHFGLFSLKERIENYEGNLEVNTAPGQGFSVTIDLPYHIDALASDSEWPAGQVEDEAEPGAVSDVEAIRVLVVDDHRLFREGIVNILQSESNLLIVGEAANGQEAVELASQLRPDLILMDINLPIMNGIQATRVISENLPGSRIVALSMNRDEATIRSIREAGAVDYVEKGSCAEDLILAINRAMGDPSSREKTA